MTKLITTHRAILNGYLGSRQQFDEVVAWGGGRRSIYGLPTDLEVIAGMRAAFATDEKNEEKAVERHRELQEKIKEGLEADKKKYRKINDYFSR